MKNILLVSMMFLGACGAANESQLTSAVSLQNELFVNDLSDINGPVHSIAIEETSPRKFKVVESKYGFVPGKHVMPEINVLLENATCERGYADEIGTLTILKCVRDMRLVDGPRIEVFLNRQDNHLFTAMKIVTTSGMDGNEGMPAPTLLGRDFERKNDVSAQ